MLSSVKVTMIAFTAFVVETDDPATVLSVKQSILEQVWLPGTGSGTFQTTISTIAPSGKTVLERSISTAAIMLSFTPSLWFVVNDGNCGERGALWQIIPIYTKIINTLSSLYCVYGINYPNTAYHA